MHMIRYTSYAITLATTVACRTGEIGIELWTHIGIKQRSTVFDAKDDVDEDRRK